MPLRERSPLGNVNRLRQSRPYQTWRRSGKDALHLVDILLNLNLEAAIRKSAAQQLLAIPWDAPVLAKLSQSPALKTLTEAALAIEAMSGDPRPAFSFHNAPAIEASSGSATGVRPSHVLQEDRWMLQSACLRIITGLAQAQGGRLQLIHDLVFRCDVACCTVISGSCLTSQHRLAHRDF